MKRLCVLLALSLISGISWGQSLEKGNLIGLHVFTLDLKPGVTFDQYKDFFLTKYIPALNKNFPDVDHYLARGNRKENKDEIGLVVVFGSQEAKEKYYQKDGSTTELMNSLLEKVQPVRARLDSLGKVTADYMEWVIE
jgi:hypothetical protein